MMDAVCTVFIFFDQKTAYEMRISDWSSDVCSSYLVETSVTGHWINSSIRRIYLIACAGSSAQLRAPAVVSLQPSKIGRASVGKECVSTCRSRWSPYH